jgi:hypothetical protein
MGRVLCNGLPLRHWSHEVTDARVLLFPGRPRRGTRARHFSVRPASRKIGEGAVEFVLTINDDAAVDVSRQKLRIKLKRLVEVRDGGVEVALAVGRKPSYA